MLAGINLDLGNFRTVNVDSAAGTMTIGGAVRASEVANALQNAGMEISTPFPNDTKRLLITDFGTIAQRSHNALV